MSVDEGLEHDDCGCSEYKSLSRRQFVGAAAVKAVIRAAAKKVPTK